MARCRKSRFDTVCCASSYVRECASGSRKLWPAQYVGSAEVARNAFAGGEKREGQVTHCDTDSRIGGHSGRAEIRIKSRLRTMLQVHAVGFIAAYRAGDQSEGRVVARHDSCAAVASIVQYAGAGCSEIGSRVRHNRRTRIAAESVAIAENLSASIDR